MKSIFCLIILIGEIAHAQSPQPSKLTGVNGTHAISGATERIITKYSKHITTKIVGMTAIEAEIHSLEDAECEALLKRDTSTLKNIWAKDFTLDDPQNEMAVGGNPIPYYVSCGRMIKRIDVMDDMVFTKGYEYARILKTDGQLAKPEVIEFFHTWMKKDGKWKLITKVNQKSSATSISMQDQ